MRNWIVVVMLLLLVSAANAQFKGIEGTFSWDDQTETLTAEEGSFPPDTEIERTTFLGRLRFQDGRSFPRYEFRFANIDPVSTDMTWRDMRAAVLQPLPLKGWFFKGQLVVEQWSETDDSPVDAGQNTYGSGYLIGNASGLQFAGGFDRRVTGFAPVSMNQSPAMANTQQTNASVRLKYDIGKLQLMAGGSTVTAVHDEALEMDRFNGGAVYKLPMNMMIGGTLGSWDDELGYSVNVGRFNDFGKFGGAPSFALNYLEIPTTYKWTNFRIMWGDRPGHYVLPTFINPVFGGMNDLNMALMLQELVPDNFRHFDTPLLFYRYDEYGKFALRINHIDTQSGYRKFDANFSTNTGSGFGAFQELRSIVTVERIHNPAFGWQDLRYHVTGAAYLNGKVYTGITYGTDFSEFNRIMVELRYVMGLGK